MHEIGTLYEVIKCVEHVALENHAKKVEFIGLDVGELSGMMPLFFERYYPIVIEDKPLFDGSYLKITESQGEGVCNDCGTHYNVRANEGFCPACRSRDKRILSGQELLITEVGIS